MNDMLKKITITINGKKRTIEIDVRKSLLDVLREDLELTGTKKGCEVGECGACAVLINGESIDSCIYLAVWADGKDIVTIEGISENGKLSEMQQAFIDEGAIQCGFCTPGFIISATGLINRKEKLSIKELKREMSGHLCRCTGYHNIVKAVDKVINKQ
ncbi:MAG: (2Fe-2S)-binding protein [Spirochaetes bacterium]|jgi:carbon-monoxide dehydrogenase small subunit|nr:(2Fe-2S)-binding protein [Spirochaetota bacterium]